MKHLPLLILILLITACSSDREENENCKFLLKIGVYETVNLNFPQFGNLNSPGNSTIIPGGNAGIIVANLGLSFIAWDAADPNHILSTCSTLEPNGLVATCQCEDKNKYDLSTGRPVNDGSLQCALRNYRVERNGNLLVISN